MAKAKPEPEEIIEPDLCPKCSTPMAEEDGKRYCPNCDAEIDWDGEEED